MTYNHFDFPIRVYYEDTDAGGIVYHASYIRFAERARTELLRHHNIQNSNLMDEHKLLFVVRRMEVDYLKPARLDDELIVSTHIEWMRNSSLLMHQEISHDNASICVLDVTIVTVNKDGKPIRLPDYMREIFIQYLNQDEN